MALSLVAGEDVGSLGRSSPERMVLLVAPCLPNQHFHIWTCESGAKVDDDKACACDKFSNPNRPTVTVLALLQAARGGYAGARHLWTIAPVQDGCAGPFAEQLRASAAGAQRVV